MKRPVPMGSPENSYCESKQQVTVSFCHQILTGFQNSFTGTLVRKFAVTRLLNSPGYFLDI